jgi:hypothetical protein
MIILYLLPPSVCIAQSRAYTLDENQDRGERKGRNASHSFSQPKSDISDFGCLIVIELG